MQFDRRQARASRTAKNFISKNKSSVNDKSRKELEAKKVEKGQGRTRPTGQQVKNNNASRADTVTISKDYLQRLLNSNVMKEHVDDFNSLPVSLAPLSSPPPAPPHFNAGPRRSHDGYDRGQRETHAEMDHSHNTAARQTNRTAHDEWMDGIAVQVQERQKEKERLRREKKNERVEEYFPFGRPGCGAPIRSESGRLLTDYQERASMCAPEKGRHHQHMQYPPQQQYIPPPRHGRRYSPSPPRYSYRRSPSPPPPPRRGYKQRSPSPPPRRRGYKQRSPSPPPRHRGYKQRSPSPPPRRRGYQQRSPSPPSHRQHYRRSPSPQNYHSHRGYERSPSPQSPSPTPPPADTYHRGTINRPVHPSMRSSIPFGPGGGGAVRERRVEKSRPRERARKIEDTGGHRSEPSHTSGSHHQHKVSGPHYGRGAGPHVNEYVLQEKSDRMRKDEQHKDFLKRQILEKQRQKEAERLRKEREDQEDEIRLKQEREQIEKTIQLERQREKDKAEAEARRQEFMQEKIRLATEAAVRAKEEAKRLKAQASPRRKHQNRVPEPDSYQHGPTTSYHRSDDHLIQHHDRDSNYIATNTVSQEKEVHQKTSRQPQAVKNRSVKENGRETTSAARNRGANRAQVESGKRKDLRVSAHQSVPQRRTTQRPDGDRPSNSKATFPNSVARTKPAGVKKPPVSNPHNSRVQPQLDITAAQINRPRLQPPTSPPVPAIARKLAKSSQEPPKRQLCLPPIVEAQHSDSYHQQQQHVVDHSGPLQPATTEYSSDSDSPPLAADGLSYGYSYGSQSLPTPSAVAAPAHTLPAHTMDGGQQLPPLIKFDNRTSSNLEVELQNHAQKLNEQERLIKMLEQQLKEEQQHQQRQRDQQQLLKQLASLKMGILQCKTK